MSDERTDVRPVPVPPSVRELIRKVAPEAEAPETDERRFTIDRTEWVARVAGEGAAGAAAIGAAHFVVVRFEPGVEGDGRERDRADGERAGDDRRRPRRGRRRDPGRKLRPREALIPRGRFEFLYDEELIELFHTARVIPEP